jgi:hypothetical protein
MFVDGSAKPQLTSVLALLRTMKMGLAVVPRDDAPTDEDVLASWLAHYGAPLYGEITESAKTMSVEETLAKGLVMARKSGTVARALPCAFWTSREKLNLQDLLDRSKRLKQSKALGFFLDLTTVVSGRAIPTFEKIANSLRARHAPTPLLSRPEQFFTPTTKREKALAELCTPEVARRWGFRMNMDLECFVSLFRKVMS